MSGCLISEKQHDLWHDKQILNIRDLEGCVDKKATKIEVEAVRQNDQCKIGSHNVRQTRKERLSSPVTSGELRPTYIF